jgi:hypothetical protein
MATDLTTVIASSALGCGGLQGKSAVVEFPLEDLTPFHIGPVLE